jgi:hypothetical protein
MARTWRSLRPEAIRVEGWTAAEWIALDYGDVIVHVFDEAAQVQHDGVLGQLVLGRHHGGVRQGSDETGVRAASDLAVGHVDTQWATPSTTSAAAKGTVRATIPTIA